MDVIIETLKAMRDGEFLQELESQVRDIVEAVRATQKKGKIQINITFTPGKAHMLLVEDDVKLTRPEEPRDRSSVFFPTDNNDLSRRDPRQPSLLPDRPRVVSMPQSAAEGTQS